MKLGALCKAELDDRFRVLGADDEHASSGLVNGKNGKVGCVKLEESRKRTPVE